MKLDGSNIGHIEDYNLRILDFDSKSKDSSYPIYKTTKNLISERYQSMKCDTFNLIIDELKKEFKIPYAPKARIFRDFRDETKSLKSPDCKSEIMIYKISDDFINISKFKDKELLQSSSFVYEMRRLIIFRYLMCLNCSSMSKILVKISTEHAPKIQYPVSAEEISFEKDSATVFSDKITRVSDSFEIPDTLIEKWFAPSDEQISLNISNHEFFYDSIKDFLIDVDISDFKDRLKSKIYKYMKEYRDRKHASVSIEEQKFYALKEKKIEKLLWWSNAVYERSRQYK